MLHLMYFLKPLHRIMIWVLSYILFDKDFWTHRIVIYQYVWPPYQGELSIDKLDASDIFKVIIESVNEYLRTSWVLFSLNEQFHHVIKGHFWLREGKYYPQNVITDRQIMKFLSIRNLKNVYWSVGAILKLNNTYVFY